METKTLLRLIRDDISHLEGITGEFSLESLPTADEVELALVRANALLRQLELLHKTVIRDQNIAPPHPESGLAKVEVLERNISEPDKDNIVIDQSEKMPPVVVRKEQIVVKQISETPILIEESVSPVIEITRDDNVIIAEDPAVIPEAAEIKHTDESGESHQLVNDLLSQEKSESGYQIIPINSMWDGIGINDRFLFVRELFENDSSKFEKTVTALNAMPTIQEVVNYLKINFKWHKTEASQKFLVLVKRRFTN